MKLHKESPPLILLPSFRAQKDNLEVPEVTVFMYGFHKRGKLQGSLTRQKAVLTSRLS